MVEETITVTIGLERVGLAVVGVEDVARDMLRLDGERGSVAPPTLF